ncbi:hypothetical protein HanRHA438_Chr09g0393881 [Helianthus annuus]|uniref:Uncharacterized protein n=1 Tax=Helianthus annuus TaxID=4232 RepID=A0A251TUR3_HELAN|nr:hypothetical protein HanXRQr2_Chr09g0382361 [Helianthus annuus]KAJ0525591.1 hypothetical protein HanHA300_Chr09g0313781 [Helianthus annuus]KAJ0533755.1 hypothetical protein HanIR_Chr09g0412021 [Helianthus annuus]KAJ0541974.1 hypothetical protein HanHA89_Chr09g0334651 [Helianthus annuus]KAJ0707039.1 hypothetical protein HanLR1_Chr09g0314001 [Helianthus annuus]
MEPNNSINKQQMCLWILSVVATVQVFVEQPRCSRTGQRTRQQKQNILKMS